MGQGPDDFVVDKLHGNRLLVACSEREYINRQGSVWAINTTNNRAIQLPIQPKPNFYFQPHGVSLYVENDTSYLFVISHDTTKQSEIVRFVVLNDHLILDKRFTNILGNPNDLFVVGLNEFYYGDYKVLGGGIVHYNEEATLIKRQSGLPNGILVEGHHLYYATTLNGKLKKLDLRTGKSKKVVRVKGADNIMPFDKENFLVASHGNFLKFTIHAINHSKFSPSTVYKINKNSGYKELVFQDTGENISALSTAMFINDRLFAGQVFKDYILVLKY